MERTYTIYAIRCKANGKVYVGSTSNFNRRMHEHFYDLTAGMHQYHSEVNNKQQLMFQLDYYEYGLNGFEIIILDENIPQRFKRYAEQFYISSFKSLEIEYGYNKRAESANLYNLLRSKKSVNFSDLGFVIGKRDERHRCYLKCRTQEQLNFR